MKTINIKYDMPEANAAGKRLKQLLRETPKKDKVLKIIHGYGSTGVGGDIKHKIHKTLRNSIKEGLIVAFIPGDAINQLKGFDTEIATYKPLIATDIDFKNANPGITYVIL